MEDIFDGDRNAVERGKVVVELCGRADGGELLESDVGFGTLTTVFIAFFCLR
jgi:hypothetical protein